MPRDRPGRVPVRRGRLLRRWAVALPLAGLGAVLPAQTLLEPRERLDFDRPEAWGMKYAAAVASFTPLSPPNALPPGAVELGLEMASVPTLSREERRIGFNGTKVEEIDRAPAFGRMRATVGLPHRFVAELGVVPPFELDGLEPTFVAVAVARSFAGSGRLGWGVRGRLEHGTIEGDITCSRSDVAAGSDPVGNPFGCEAPSRDELELDVVGGELVVSLRPHRDGGLEPYLALGGQHLDGAFQVDARYAGLHDRTRLDAEGWIWSVTLGVSGRLGRAWRLAGELYHAPLDIRRPGRGVDDEPVTNFRLTIFRRL